MEKPGKVIPVKSMLDYHQVIKYIEETYNFKVRDYHETYPKDREDWEEYMDFWHWFVVQCNVENDTVAYLDIKGCLEDKNVKPWIKQILEIIKQEFYSDLDKEGGLELWISW